MAEKESGAWSALSGGVEHVGSGFEAVIIAHPITSLLLATFIACFGIWSIVWFKTKRADRESSVYKDVNLRCFDMVDKAIAAMQQRNLSNNLPARMVKPRGAPKKRK